MADQRIAKREQGLILSAGKANGVDSLKEHLGVFVEMGRVGEGGDDGGVLTCEGRLGHADRIGANE